MNDPNMWMNDEREIIAVTLAANPTVIYGKLGGTGPDPKSSGPATFERFERNGEYCMLPWIRIFSPTGNTVEAPLTQVMFITYSQATPAPATERPEFDPKCVKAAEHKPGVDCFDCWLPF